MIRPRPLVIVAFLATLILHVATTFLAWAFHPGNMAVQPSSPTWFQVNGFRILGAPSFQLLPEQVSTEFFWSVLLFNSLLWATAVAAALSLRVAARRPRVEPP